MTTGNVYQGLTYNGQSNIALVNDPDILWTQGTSLSTQTGFSATFHPGCAIYLDISGELFLAKADSLSTSQVAGLMRDTANVTSQHQPVCLQSDGIITSVIDTQWDTLNGTSGGLVTGSFYYLSDTTAGALTTTAPTTIGHYVVPIGVAVGDQSLQLCLGQPQLVKANGGYTLSLTNDNAGSAVIGSPVYIKSNGHFDLAKADSTSTTFCLGLVQGTSIASSAAGLIQVGGLFTATTTQWDAIAGTSGGLAPGSHYYVSDSTAGNLVNPAPSTVTHFLVKVGRAISSTQMELFETPHYLQL